jgi:signal transduction histidine kinase
MTDKISTKFAAAERSDEKKIKEEAQKILQKNLFMKTINAFPEIVMFLDANRQVVFCNEMLLKTLGVTDPSTILGKRPGEMFDCVHSKEEEGGCGTSKFCTKCGAVKAILEAQKGNQAVEECRMMIKTNNGEEALDLRVWAVPVDIADELFTIFTVKDIRNEKRRELLERTFFHDILNETSIFTGYLDNVQDGIMEPDEEVLDRLSKAASRMIDTIQGQRDLLYIENGEYEISKEKVSFFNLFNELVQFFSGSKWGKDKKIVLDLEEKQTVIATDRVLLRRILINLIKNALEASSAGDEITVGYKSSDSKNIIYVQNPTVMDQSVQLQVFKRSFSTKGKGRGIGTYSVKLFVEKYLGGKVSFVSQEGEGTTFFVEI